MRRALLPLIAGTALAACATTPGGQRLAERDPLERFNRSMWDVNMALDKALLKPTAQAYRTVTPRPARRGLSRLLDNLDEPWSAINALLQGKPDQAMRTLGRFAINTTLGVGGLADHATGMGLPAEDEDFGQTLAVWGVNAGPYLVLPLLGPSTLRDSVGFGVQLFADPQNIAIRNSGLTRTQQWGVNGFQVIDLRAKLIDIGADAILDTSADPYATARSAYLQQQAALISNQAQTSEGLDPADFEGGSGLDPADFAGAQPSAPAGEAPATGASDVPGAQSPAPATPGGETPKTGQSASPPPDAADFQSPGPEPSSTSPQD